MPIDTKFKIREDVYNKMEQEFNSFLEKLKIKSAEEIIQCSYEKVMKEEILGMFYPTFEINIINRLIALNKCKKPLEEL